MPALGMGAVGLLPPLIHLLPGGATSPSQTPAEVAARGGDPFARLSMISRSSLKPGDILVSTEDAFISGVIRTATGASYSHAALYVGDGKIVDATKPGVTLRNLSDLTGHASRVGVIRAASLTDAQRDQVVGTAKGLLGQKYNTTGLVTGIVAEFSPVYQLYRRLWGSGRYGMAGLVGRGYFCSELVIKAYKSAGITVAPESADSPSTIIRYTAERPQEFQLVGRLPVGGE